MQTYVCEIIELCHQVDPTMSEGQRVEHALKGLIPTILDKVGTFGPRTMPEVIMHARRAMHTESLLIDGLSRERVGNNSPGNSEIARELQHLRDEVKRLREIKQTNWYKSARPFERSPPRENYASRGYSRNFGNSDYYRPNKPQN